MEFASPLTQAILLKRLKRFLAEIVVNNQEHRIIYCPNMGAMTGCDTLGSRIWFSHSSNTRRKFPDTWELIEVDTGYLVSINTLNTISLLKEGIETGIVKELQGYTQISVTPPSIEEHQFDLLLQNQTEKCFVTVNHVTLGDEIHRGFFPDAISEKWIYQLKALMRAKELGSRTIMFYCVQHTGIEKVFPSDHIDFKFGCLLRQALLMGIEIIAYGVEISLKEIHIAKPVEICIPARLICSSRSEKSK